MIIIDRMFRLFSKDINLPIRCYASRKQLYSPKCKCDCNLFCKKISGTPVYQMVTLPPSSKKYYYHIINEQKYKQ